MTARATVTASEGYMCKKLEAMNREELLEAIKLARRLVVTPFVADAITWDTPYRGLPLSEYTDAGLADIARENGYERYYEK